jgi:hypothetical protein
MTTCVCGHDSAAHYAHTGQCHGPCGCSYYDDGSETPPSPPNAPHTPYAGAYNRRYSLEESA